MPRVVGLKLGEARLRIRRHFCSVGTITIDRLTNVLYVGRPAYGEPNRTIGMFKLVEGGKYAVRVSVRLGRASVNTVEVLQGLQAGDLVILSDMTRYDGVDRVRVK